MSTSSQSGAGSRPTTSGTVDNLGGGDSFRPDKPGDSSSPAPTQRMSEKRSDAKSVEQDDSAPWGMTESAEHIEKDRNKESHGP